MKKSELKQLIKEEISKKKLFQPNQNKILNNIISLGIESLNKTSTFDYNDTKNELNKYPDYFQYIFNGVNYQFMMDWEEDLWSIRKLNGSENNQNQHSIFDDIEGDLDTLSPKGRKLYKIGLLNYLNNGINNGNMDIIDNIEGDLDYLSKSEKKKYFEDIKNYLLSK